MESKLTFEVGKAYRCRDGKKATILLIQPTYMVGKIEERSTNPFLWRRGGGWLSEPIEHSCDLVDEWREPERVTVYVYRHVTTGG